MPGNILKKGLLNKIYCKIRKMLNQCLKALEDSRLIVAWVGPVKGVGDFLNTAALTILGATHY